MAKYRSRPPQLNSQIFLTEGGANTGLIYHREIELTHFASFVLLDNELGQQELRRYYSEYIELAMEFGLGIILDTPT
ncbi:hypothetical protein [Rhizobium lusitanum]|uniref:hypothetical protein n=1 Tax=Rhizobium lusitanum TaxID=293958 RepID=UPI001FEE8EEC|nr:hypothetical protein [Rhizobium lusitanum]